MIRTCEIQNCENKHLAKGFCIKHYTRHIRYGDSIFIKTREKGTGSIRNGYHVIGKKRNGVNKVISVHRLIMESHLGRRLKSTELVHHINHDKLDNRIENLQIMSKKAHNKLHHPKGVISGSENGTIRKSLRCVKWSYKNNADYCILCKRDSMPHVSYGHCRKCYTLLRRLAFKKR